MSDKNNARESQHKQRTRGSKTTRDPFLLLSCSSAVFLNAWTMARNASFNCKGFLSSNCALERCYSAAEIGGQDWEREKRERGREEEERSGYLWMWWINSAWISRSTSVCDMLKGAFVAAPTEEEKAKRAFFSWFGLLLLFCSCNYEQLCASDIFCCVCTSSCTSRALLKEQ